MHPIDNRRGFLTKTALATALAGAAGILGMAPRLVAGATPGEPPPETTTLRLSKWAGICLAPQYLAEELLRAEGFTDIQYLDVGPVTSKPLADGVTDFSLEFSPDLLIMAEAERPVTVLAGVHVGCLELFAHGDIHTIADLRGKTVGLPALDAGEHLFMLSIAAYVGLDPLTEIAWVGGAKGLFEEGKVDAYFSGPPETQDLHARGIGHVVLRTAVDDPWSQYYCCMLTANTAFMQSCPAATKRVVRAIMKATDLCYQQPEWVSQRLVDQGFVDRYDYALEALTQVRYGVWREFDPEDTVRFYALRLHEVGMVRSTPNELIARLTDWRFLNEVRQELKV